MKSSFPSTVICVLDRIFHLGFVLVTEIFEAHDRKKEPSEMFKDDQKRIKCVYLAILSQIYSGVLST